MATILELILKGRDAGASAAVKGLDKALGGLMNILGGLGLGLGTAELIKFGQESVAAARESAAAEGQLEAALASTGNAAGVTKEQLIALATALENNSTFSDEAVMKGEELLLTFTKIGKDVFPQATQAIADMSTRFGQDLSSSAIQLGKALNDPIAGLSALTRIGVQFTEQQKQQVAAMMQVGDIAGAQGIILAEIATQTAGAAQAARDAAGGAQDWLVAVSRLQEAFGGLMLAIGDSGVGGAATGLVDTLAEGSTVWTTNVEQIQLFVDALIRANAELNNTGAVVAPATAELSEFQKSQKGLEIIFLTVANAAIESTVGFEALADAYGEVKQEADEAAPAIRDAAAAASEMSSASTRAASASYASMRGMMAQAGAARQLESAFRQSEAAAATATAAAAFGGQSDAFTQNLNLTGIQAAGDARVQAQAEALAEQGRLEEMAAQQSERIFTQSSQAMVQATSELGNQISSAVSGAISGVNQDVIGQLLGIEGAEANAGEAVRRMAAVAAGGINDQWAPALAAQLTGVQDKTAQAFVQAFQAGDSGALQAAAGQLALNPIVELFDANLIAQQVEQKLRAQQLTQQLNDKVNALLGEKGLPAVTAVTQQVGQAATDTGIATGQVTQGTAEMAASAETAAAQVLAAFTAALPAVNLLITRLEYMVGIIVRIGVVSQQSAGSVAGLNPPGAPAAVPAGTSANGVPNGAQWKIGGVGMIE